MKVTYGQIYLMVGETPQSPLNTLRQKELPIRGSLKLKRIVRALEPLFSDLMSERNKLVDKFGEDGIVKFDSEQFQQFAAANKELMETEIDLDITPLRLEDLGDITMSEVDLEALVIIKED